MSLEAPFALGRGREPGCPRPLNLLASRDSSLGRLLLPPIPRDGGALAVPLRGDGSRGGGALRFGARYGSSDSLPMAPRLPTPDMLTGPRVWPRPSGTESSGEKIYRDAGAYKNSVR